MRIADALSSERDKREYETSQKKTKIETIAQTLIKNKYCARRKHNFPYRWRTRYWPAKSSINGE